jgi:hypothetical protein
LTLGLAAKGGTVARHGGKRKQHNSRARASFLNESILGEVPARARPNVKTCTSPCDNEKEG